MTVAFELQNEDNTTIKIQNVKNQHCIQQFEIPKSFFIDRKLVFLL